MDNHFDSIAEIFNQSWHFSDRYKNWMIDHVVNHLQLNPDDRLVDLGGGTGNYTVQFATKAQLIHKPYCVEPSGRMCDEARKIESLNVIHACANSFVEMGGLDYNKVLMKEMVHHIEQREQVWKYLKQRLQANGQILIVTRPRQTPIPLFTAAKKQFSINQPDHETLIKELETAGFNVQIESDTYAVKTPKERWFNMLRNRFMSDLSSFTDDEIEQGIEELQKTDPEDEHIILKDQVLFIKAVPLI